jgi:Ca-activated chloride channel family protein
MAVRTRLPHNIEMPGCTLVAGAIEFPLTEVKVKGHVDGHGIVWVVTQTFSNPLTEPAEAVYKFPLPYNGAVNGMRMSIADRVVEAVIKERGEAREEYKEAKALGHTAALVEQERAEIFTTHVGNIHPGESVSVVITIHCEAAVDGDEATLRFPMMVKERYNPGSQIDTASTNSPRVSGPIAVDTHVTVTFESPVTGLVCDTVPGARIDRQAVTITDSAALKTDIVLRWDAAREVTTAKWTEDAPVSPEGTVEVTIRTEGKAMPTANKRAVSILLDRSGSMAGHYLEWARRIIESIIATLGKDDLVHAMTFDSDIEVLGATAHGFTTADRATCAALLQELATVDARGGTNLVPALNAVGAALGTLQSNEPERVVVILTDGAYGDEAAAMRYRREQLAGARVITVAIGQDANGFLDALAADGTCIFVEAQHGVAAAAQKVVDRLSTPAHRHARLVADGLTEQAPHIAPDIYPHLVVRLAGRMTRPAPGATLEIVSDDGTIAVVPISVSRDSSITTRWASQRIKALDADVMAEQDEAKVSELEKLITELSIRHSVLSKYTAWLAVDRSRTTDSVVVRRLAQPDYALDSGVSTGMGLASWHSPVLTLRRMAPRPANRRFGGVLYQRSAEGLDMVDDVEPSDWSAPTSPKWVFRPLLTIADLARAIRLLLDEAQISDEAFAELNAEAINCLALLPESLETKKLVKAITKLFARVEKALAKGNEALARRHLSDIADQLEKSSA